MTTRIFRLVCICAIIIMMLCTTAEAANNNNHNNNSNNSNNNKNDTVNEGITISYWVKLNEYPSTLGYIEPTKGNNKSSCDYSVLVLSNGDVAFEVVGTNNKDSITYINSSGAITLHTLTHLACTDNGTTSAIYINGKQKSLSEHGTILTKQTGRTVSIGRKDGSNERNSLNGTIYEITVYDIALSAAEINTLYSDSIGDINTTSPTITISNPGYPSIISDNITMSTNFSDMGEMYDNVTTEVTSGYALAAVALFPLGAFGVLRYLGYI